MVLDSRLQVSKRRKDHLAGGETMVPYGAKSHACEKKWPKQLHMWDHVRETWNPNCPSRARPSSNPNAGRLVEARRRSVGWVTAEKSNFWSQPSHVVGFDATLHDWPLDDWMCRNAARFLRSDSGSIRFKTLRCRSPTQQTQVKNYYPMGYPNKSLTITIQLSKHV